ncbi:MAG: hypothetical protein IPK75_20145 [Acidobacteria bacterium]|nr:hypothetical protein [Acidobacteriota bacterium]
MAIHLHPAAEPQTPEAAAFARYKALFEEACRLGDDLKELDAELKDEIHNHKSIKRLARLAAKNTVLSEAKKFRDLQRAASASGQHDLFAVLDT